MNGRFGEAAQKRRRALDRPQWAESAACVDSWALSACGGGGVGRLGRVSPSFARNKKPAELPLPASDLIIDADFPVKWTIFLH